MQGDTTKLSAKTINWPKLISECKRALLFTIMIYAINILVDIFFARWLGAERFGDYSIAKTLLWFCALIAMLGANSSLIKFIPTYVSQQDWGSAHGYLRSSLTWLLIASFAIAVFGAVIVVTVEILEKYGLFHSDRLHIVFYVLWLVPLLSTISFLASLLRGLQELTISLLSSSGISEILALIGTFILLKLTTNLKLSHIFLIVGMASLITIGIQLVTLNRRLPKEILKSTPKYHKKRWLNVSIPLMVSGIIFSGLECVDLLVLEIISKNEGDVGIFAAILTITSLMFLIQSSVALIIGPLIGPAVENNNKAALQHLADLSNKLIFFSSPILGIILIIFGKPILGYFGSEFTAGYLAYTILLLNAIGTSAVEMSAQLLIYSDQQRAYLLATAGALVFNIIASVVLVSWLQLLGAAISFCLTWIALYAAYAVLVYKRMGLYPSFIRL